ncbi:MULTISPECIES: glycosyltransferase family 1 protein [unclassified Pantoea]|uniref:glycosyltransferase family 4 protein n=1 Tax=unclassified Pantoea TaxID=2630326 RepID=UPI001FAA5A8C|nr:glycosyltransferase family 1 protein [Pantoea sp. MQR6]
MHNVWVDVTTILGWHRAAVGIVRTEVECAHYALHQITGQQVKFCGYSVQSGYYEVSRSQVEETIARINGSIKTPAEKKVDTQLSERFETRLKKHILKFIGKIPHRYQRKVFSYLLPRKPAVVSCITSLRYAKLALTQWFKPVRLMPQIQFTEGETAIGLKYPFHEGDTYISLGLDWDQKDFGYLYKIKKEANLIVKLFCYDVIPVKLPHLCVGDVAGKFAHYFSNVAWCADEIFCISKCSRNDLAELLKELGTPIPKLTIVKLGCELPVNKNEDDVSLELRNLMSKPYLLFVSTIERRKNHEVLYKAYTRLIDQKVPNLPLLIFVGMQGWGMNDFITDLNLDPRVKGKIIQLNNITDPELSQLYKNALFTVYPSLYEGWGLPVAESLAFGKYCLASSAASVPEVAGELLDYIDPWDVPEWAEKIKHFIEHPDEIKRRELRIQNEFAPTKWSETAASILNS